MDDKALLWHLYEDNRSQAQFHETQRINGTGLIGGGAAIIISQISQDAAYTRADTPLAVILVVIGLFGYLYCLKAYERMQLHLNRCREFLQMLDDMDTMHDLISVKNCADKATKKQFKFASKLKLRVFWQGIHILIAIAGLLIIARIYLS